MAEFIDYEIWLGTFEGENFVWKVIKRLNSFDEAYAFYHDYIMKQSKYDDEELKKVWSSGRIDVELRQGKKLINWCGIFSRRVADPLFDPYEAEKKAKAKKGKAKEAEASDSSEVRWGIQSNTSFGVTPIPGTFFETEEEAQAEADHMNEEARGKGFYPDVIYEVRMILSPRDKKGGASPAADPSPDEEGDWQVVAPSAHFIWGCDSEEMAREQLEYVISDLGYEDAFIERFDGQAWKRA